jgi:hypothetical protein
VSADKELHRGAATKLTSLGDVRPVTGGEVGFRGLGSPSGVCQSLSERRVEPAALRIVLRTEINCLLVENRRPSERQSLRRLLGGTNEEIRRSVRLSGPEVVGSKQFGIGVSSGIQRSGQAAVALAQLIGRKPGHDRLANSVVVCLDPLDIGTRRSSGTTHEAGRSKQGERCPLIAGAVKALASDRWGERPA